MCLFESSFLLISYVLHFIIYKYKKSLQWNLHNAGFVKANTHYWKVKLQNFKWWCNKLYIWVEARTAVHSWIVWVSLLAEHATLYLSTWGKMAEIKPASFRLLGSY